MSKYTLNISFSTYCRGEQFLKDIQALLTSKDIRFRITVQDNHSEDGSFEALQSIEDERFVVRQNDKNLTSHPNHKKSLLNNPDAEYILFSIDKDFVNPEYISQFVDYLEKEKPYYGYLNLHNAKGQEDITYEAGVDAITNLGYLCKHPSGFFWRRYLLEQEMQQDYFTRLPMTFDFWFDLATAHLAAKYPGQVCNIPLFIHAPFRKEYQGKLVPTLSYNEDNIYFGFPKRMETFEIFLKDLTSLEISKEVLQNVAFHLLRGTLGQVTIGLRAVFHKKNECIRYNLKYRTYSLSELMSNARAALNLYKREMKGHESALSLFAKCFLAYNYTLLRTAKFCLTEKYEKE